MPLVATHVKFALDKKDTLDIKELDKYLSGSVYPDSRFITKVERKITHVKNLSLEDAGLSDFQKGWAIHCVCDHAYEKLFKDYLSLYLEVCRPDCYQYGSDWWVSLTAVKNILEMFLYKQFDMQKYLLLLKNIENASNESLEDMQKYSDLIQNIYLNKVEIGLKEVEDLWRGLGLEKEILEKVVKKTEEFLKDKKIVKKIEELYSFMI